MSIKNIIPGQKINPRKLQRARELRHDMTPEERILWGALRGNKLNVHFRRQQVIAGFIVDFYCYSASLVVEIDGDIHKAQKDLDENRDTVLRDIGFRVLHFTNNEVAKSLPQVLERIKAALKAGCR